VAPQPRSYWTLHRATEWRAKKPARHLYRNSAINDANRGITLKLIAATIISPGAVYALLGAAGNLLQLFGRKFGSDQLRQNAFYSFLYVSKDFHCKSLRKRASARSKKEALPFGKDFREKTYANAFRTGNRNRPKSMNERQELRNNIDGVKIQSKNILHLETRNLFRIIGRIEILNFDGLTEQNIGCSSCHATNFSAS
jgi:hypothetical protein